MLEVVTETTLEAIGREAWSACHPGALEDFDYLAAVEKAGLPGFDWLYLLVHDKGRPLAAAPAFVTDYALDTTLNAFGRQAVATLRRWSPRAFTVRLGALGSPCTETLGLGFAPDLPDTSRPDVLHGLLNAFVAEAAKARCGLVALKDTPGPDQALWDLAAGGFQSIPGLPVAHLEIDFPDLDTYLARLSPGVRRDMRRKLRAREGLQVEVREDLAGLEGAVHDLYVQTRARADMQFESLTPAYFTGVLERMPGRALCVLYWQDGDLLAANLLLQDGSTLLDKFFCMDGARGRSANLYFVSWFTNLQLCLDRGLARYVSGQAGYGAKLRLGSTLTPTALRFRHRSPLVHRALCWAAPLLSDDPTAVAA